MIKLIRIMYISWFLGMYCLQGAEYNVITVSRDTTAASYNRLAPEEIYLVFTQLARYFSALDVSSFAPEYNWSKQAKDIFKKPVVKLNNLDIPTIVVFNEAFFGQDNPLSKKEVNEIIDVYKKFQFFMPNLFLYINFLYTDVKDAKYEKQIKVSINRYHEITREFKFPSFCFNKIQNYIMDSTEGPTGEQILLFNQTKIFYGNEEIGYYNKSSFCDEYSKFLDEKLYYVIGKFDTKYLIEKPHLPVDCLICYDIDVISNEMYKKYMPKTQICVFPSNSNYSLPATLSFFDTGKNHLSNFYICVDGHCIDEEEETTPLSIICNEESMYRLNGVFKYESQKLSSVRCVTEFIFEYKTAFEQKDRFVFKNFHLQLD